MSDDTDTRQEQPAGAAGDERPPMERAEELVDLAGERVGAFVATLGQRAQVFVARAREEAEDIWAEAQALRQREQP